MGKLDSLLVVEWNSTAKRGEEWGILDLEVFFQVVDLPEALHILTDVEEHGTMWGFLHLTSSNVI